MTHKKIPILTKELVLEFLSHHKLMSVATYGDFPWIATVYYPKRIKLFDQKLFEVEDGMEPVLDL